MIYPRASMLILCLYAATSCVVARPKSANDLQAFCSTIAIDDRIELRVIEGNRISACPPDAEEGCPYNAELGQTSLDDTPDLNNDGRKDAIITYSGSSYGDIDVTDKLVLAQCPDGTYVRLLEGKFTSLVAPKAPHAIWPELVATRDCPIGQDGKTHTDRISLSYDTETSQYRGTKDVDLRKACEQH